MGDPTDKDTQCNGCYHEGQSYMAYPCDSCTRAYSGMQKDYYKTVDEVEGLPLYINNEQYVEEEEKPLGGAGNYRQVDLAEAHWKYIKSLLEAHGEDSDEVYRIGFHYKSAFIHGYKHAMEDVHNEL
jgi:hypothetical protein